MELAAEPRPWQRIFAAGRKLHQVVHGEEVRLVPQLRDECELVLDESAHVRRHSLRPTPLRAVLGQLAQPSCGACAHGHQLLGVLVAQLIERKLAALGDAFGFFEQRARIQTRQFSARAQVPLAARLQFIAHIGYRLVEADRGEQILQRASFADMHLDAATCHERQVQHRAEFCQRSESAAIVTGAQQLYSEPGALRAQRACSHSPCAGSG